MTVLLCRQMEVSQIMLTSAQTRPRLIIQHVWIIVLGQLHVTKHTQQARYKQTDNAEVLHI